MTPRLLECPECSNKKTEGPQVVVDLWAKMRPDHEQEADLAPGYIQATYKVLVVMIGTVVLVKLMTMMAEFHFP